MKTHAMSITGLVMRRFPEQLAPVLDLGLDRADASEELGEVGNFLRPRRELEAWIIELSDEIIEALGGPSQPPSTAPPPAACRHWRPRLPLRARWRRPGTARGF